MLEITVNVLRTKLYASALLKTGRTAWAVDLQGLARGLLLLWKALFRVKARHHYRSEQPSMPGICAVSRDIIHLVNNSVRMPYFASHSSVVCRSVVNCVIYY